ncbi:ribose-5-phosphate isomerase RpiA [Anatilimnocola sp. NA78]|uniref:ribose-5-phosphate isomerase RpiA n=1 Tax=Anatilimnocola sp. NA78 TaxID=3415683 RepID=UPI003CE58DAD
MGDLEAEKALAAAAAVREVREGMLVGLGTGSTAAHAVRQLGVRVTAGLRIRATSTSLATEQLARSVGLELLPFETVSRVDLTIDGADEIDRTLRAIKGGGGALLREKIVAAASDRTIIIADSSKLVSVLGLGVRLPLEVLPFASAFVERTLLARGFTPTKRRLANGLEFRTDQQNYVFDVEVGTIHNPGELARWLEALPGVLEHGLFVSEIDELLIGRSQGVEVIHRQ